MIKTISYNDFTAMPIEISHNPTVLLEELIKFHEQGGNLNLSIKYSMHDKLVNAEEWFRELGHGTEFMERLFEKELLISPGTWKIEDSRIIEHPLYGAYWYRDSSELYTEHIAKGLGQLVKQLKESGVEPVSYTETDYYRKNITIDYQHPIFYLTEKIGTAAAYREVFTNNPEYTELWKAPTLFSKEEPAFISAIGANFNDISNAAVALVFYEFNIAKDYFLQPENAPKLHKLLTHAISNNNLSFLKENIGDWDLSSIEKLKKTDSTFQIENAFLRYANTAEMAQFLLEQNVFVMDDKRTIFHKEYLNKPVILETILSFKPEYHNWVKKNAAYVYQNYMEYGYKETVDLFIDKFEFPVTKYDMLQVGQRMMKYDGVSWALEKGADPRQCEKFITSCVARRDDGLSQLKALSREKLFDPFYPTSCKAPNFRSGM